MRPRLGNQAGAGVGIAKAFASIGGVKLAVELDENGLELGPKVSAAHQILQK